MNVSISSPSKLETEPYLTFYPKADNNRRAFTEIIDWKLGYVSKRSSFTTTPFISSIDIVEESYSETDN